MSESAVPTTFHERPRTGRIPVAIRIVGLCLFALYLFRGPVDVAATVEQLRGLPLGIWLLACGCNLVPPLAIALRLKCLLRGRRHEVAFLALAADSLRATALNTVALAGAGDLYRLNRLRAHGVPLATGGPIVILDRIFGVGALVAMVLVVQITGLGRTLDGARASLGVVALIFAVLLVGFIAVRNRPDGWVGQLLGRLGSLFGGQRLSWTLLSKATALSLLACGAWIICVYVLGRGLALSIPLIAYFEAAPLVALATFIPITIGGVGLREAGYVLLLASYGVSPAACIALGIAQYSTLLGIAMLGGLLFALPDRAIETGLQR